MVSDEETIELASLVVTATRSGENTFELPVAIDVLDKAIIQSEKPMVLISEDLPRADRRLSRLEPCGQGAGQQQAQVWIPP